MKVAGSGLRACLWVAVLGAVVARSPQSSYAAVPPGASPSAVFRVDGRVALASLMSLSDTHLQKLADSLATLAATAEARSADWDRIRGPLSKVAERTVAAALWFALPDGTYWTVDQGRVEQKLSDRPYFPRILAGERVIGELVVSKSTGKSVAVVAVPVIGGGTVVGTLGGSVYLDRLSTQLEREMALDKSMIFYSFDASPLVALNWDPKLIFLEPMKQDNPSLKRAFQEMLSKDEGVVKYGFRGQTRTVIYRKSPVTKWWYAFGVVAGERAPK